MLRLIKFLKPYILLIVLTIALLFIQANAELALPEYLSNIVDIGIQQFGVENAVPQAVRQSEMERLLIFMSEPEKALVLNNFFLLSPDSPSAEMFVSEYPILEEQSILVLKDINQAEVNLSPPQVQDNGTHLYYLWSGANNDRNHCGLCRKEPT